MIEDKAGARLDVLLVAGGAEPTALAGKGQEILMLTMVAPNAGEAAGQVAAFQKLVNHLRDDGAEDSVAGLVLLGIEFLELVIVAVGALPQGRLFRVASAVGLHG